MREKILSYIETNSRIDMHDLAINGRSNDHE